MRQSFWIHGPVRDAALAACWVPFAAVVAAIQWYGGGQARLAWVLSATLFLSLAHQPLTLALVYGDTDRLRDHRAVYVLGPLVALGAVVVGLRVSFTLVAVVAGLWNAEHTLMQRYGITRIYGRKAGDDHGPLERSMLLAWLAVAFVAAAANPRTPRYLGAVDVGDVNRQGIQLLAHLRPEATAALVPVIAVATILSTRWVRAERAAVRTNPAKWLYLGGTAALILTICVDPVAGFAGYVGAHALEYFVIVEGAARRRATGGEGGEGGITGAVVRSPLGSWGFVAVIAVGAVVPLAMLHRAVTASMVTTVYLTVGALHIAYDGLIWKMRSPAVARDLAAAAGPHSSWLTVADRPG